MTASYSAGVEPTASMPNGRMRARTSSALMMAAKSAAIFSMISLGVPAGAMTPRREMVSTPGRVSAIVGTAG